MNEILNKVTKLIEVKKIIALIMTTIFSILAIKGTIPTEQTMTIVTMIITYYFTQSVDKERR